MKRLALLFLFALLTLSCSLTDVAALLSPTPTATPTALAQIPPSPPTAAPAPTASAGCREEKITREATGGRTAGYLFLPNAQPGARLPAVVAIHGGFADKPNTAQATENLGRNYAERLCPLGFAVFSVDYRWSAFGMEEMEDVAGAYDYLLTRPEIDPQRLVVMGGSHGGYMTMMAVTSAKYKRPFALAVNLYGFVDIADLVTADKEKNNPQVKLTIQQLGTPDANPSAYREISPRYHIDQLDVPLLIVVGTKDQFLNQLRAFSADLKKAGKDYEYHEVDGAGHGFEQGQEPYTTTLWNYVIAFLQAHLP